MNEKEVVLLVRPAVADKILGQCVLATTYDY